MAATSRTDGARLIRRYGNRKLYDTEARRYVTLEELAGLVAGGADVAVLDQKTGEDLTNPTLVQVLLEAVRGGTNRIPRQVLTRLIRLAAGPDSGWSAWPEPHEAARRARDEAEKIVTALIGRGRLTLDDAVALRQELGQMVHRLVGEAQSGVESRLRALVERGENVAERSLSALRGRIGSYLDAPATPARGARPRPGGGRRPARAPLGKAKRT